MLFCVCRFHVFMWLFIPSPKEPRLMVNRLFPCVRRISQDLAKDLAILAREIHDVAGEIDSVSSSGTAPSTTVSTAATTPGSAIDTREEVGPARPTQPDIQDSMKKVPIFLLLIALLRVFPLHSSILMFCFHLKKKMPLCCFLISPAVWYSRITVPCTPLSFVYPYFDQESIFFYYFSTIRLKTDFLWLNS